MVNNSLKFQVNAFFVIVILLLTMRTGLHIFFVYMVIEKNSDLYFDSSRVVVVGSVTKTLELCFNLVVVYYLSSQNSR